MAARKIAKSDPDAASAADEICSIRIELLHTKPAIWREVEVPASVSLKVLHDIVQIAMGWSDCHLWQFDIGGMTYALPAEGDWGDGADFNAGRVKLRSVLKSARTRIDYLYDWGDNWGHRLTVTKLRQGDPALSYPRYVDGQGACPPEDCGGIPGFYETLEVLANPAHPDHAEMSEWFDDYDADHIDVGPIRVAFDRIATRRVAARKKPP